MKNLYVLLILLFASCATQSDDSEEILSEIPKIILSDEPHSDLSEVVEKLISQPVQGFVLIHYQTPEYSSLGKAKADTSASKSIVRLETDYVYLHMPLSVEDSSKYNWGSPLIFREVIADHGEIVEVSTTDVEVIESMGHGGLGADYMYEVITFIRKKDLVPVLSKTVQKIFDDKTQITLYPGVAVGIPWDSDLRQRAISIQQMHFECSLPDSLLALSYNPDLLELEEIEEEWMLNERDTLILGGKALCPVTDIRSTRLRTPVTHSTENGYQMVTLRENGLELTVKTHANLVENYVPNIHLPLLSSRYHDFPRWYYSVKEGTPIYWEDGRLAGKVRQDYGYQSETPPNDLTWCEKMTEFLQNEPLCFKLKDIEVFDRKKGR